MKQKVEQSKYKWYHDKKMIGTVILIFVAVIQVFAFLKIPIISSIHGYTIGMLFGFFNPLFYIFIAYIALKMIFGEKMQLPKWIKLNAFTYWFVVISIIFISTSTFHYQATTGFISIGSKPWGSFEAWFNDFTSGTAWAPTQTNGGLIGVFLYSLSTSMISGIGSLILSVSLLVISFSLILTGSFIGLYKNIHNKHKLDIKTKEEVDDSKMNFDNFIEPDKVINPEVMAPKIESEDQLIKKDIPKTNNEDIDVPFEDPFM